MSAPIVTHIGTLLLLASSEKGGPPEWIHLVPIGRWKGHESVSDFEVTIADCHTMIENFGRDGKPIAVDLDHQTQRSKANGKPAPAYAWIVALEVRPDGLWGRVEWLPDGALLVQRRQYRFVSPVVWWEDIDRVTGLPIGPRIATVALTNTPFFAGFLTPLFSDRSNPQGVSMSLLALLVAALGLPEDATEQQVVDEVTKLKTSPPSVAASAAAPKAAANFGESIMAGLGWKAPPPNAAQLVVDAMRQPAPKELESQVAELRASEARLKTEEARLKTELTAAQARCIQLEAGEAGKAIEALVVKGRAEGRITPAIESQIRILASTNLPAAEQLVAGLPSMITPQVKKTAGGGEASAAREALVASLSEADKTDATKRGIDFAVYALSKARLAAQEGAE